MWLLKKFWARKRTNWERVYYRKPVISIITGNAIIGPVMRRVWNGEVQYRESTASEEMEHLEDTI